jgi:hypothetical protein
VIQEAGKLSGQAWKLQEFSSSFYYSSVPCPVVHEWFLGWSPQTSILFGRGLHLEKLSYKLGSCVVCGQRIYSDQEFVKSAEGYCCGECLTEEDVVTA